MADAVAVVGLGSIGNGAARSLLRAGFTVRGYDVRTEATTALAAEGGVACADPSEAAAGASVVLLFVVDAGQTRAVLAEALPALPADAVVVSCVTMAPADAEAIGAEVAASGRMFIDAPSSGGPTRAEDGSMILIASGPPEAFERAGPALAAIARKVHRLGERPGDGSRLKLINQLLAGVHIAVVAEALGLAARLGLDPAVAQPILMEGAATSFMLGDRGARMLQEEPPIHSAIAIWLKDLGIVAEAGEVAGFPLPLAIAALTQFRAAAEAGQSRDDDSTVLRVYQRATASTPST